MVTRLFVVLALAALALADAAVAEPAPAPNSVREACKADLKQFCATVPPWGRMQCMKRHGSELSEACKHAYAQSRAHPSDDVGQGGHDAPH
ncbi:MAG: hypothetical protein ACHP7N_01800 [Caulobacterales bacterium]